MKLLIDILGFISLFVFLLSACLVDSEPFMPIFITLVTSGTIMFGCVFIERRLYGTEETN